MTTKKSDPKNTNQFTANSIIGCKFGYWTVLEKLGKMGKSGMGFYLCECACGTIKPVQRAFLTGDKTRSCGCYKKSEEYKTALKELHINNKIKHIQERSKLIGTRFGFLTPLSVIQVENSRSVYYKCLCDCGNECKKSYSVLINNRTQSCGCKKSSTISKLHGGTGIAGECLILENNLRKTPSYRKWRLSVLKTHNNSCVITGDTKNLHVHHIIPFSLILKEYNIVDVAEIKRYDSFLFNVSNGTVLTNKLHTEFHAKYGKCGKSLADNLLHFIQEKQQLFKD